VAKAKSAEEILEVLQALVAEIGPEVTLQKFAQRTGISIFIIYNRWESWTKLRLAAGLTSRSKVPQHFTDDELMRELNAVCHHYNRYPTVAEFDRQSARSWQTLEDRFVSKKLILKKYREWLRRHGRREQLGPAARRGLAAAAAGEADAGQDALTEDRTKGPEEKEPEKTVEGLEEVETVEVPDFLKGCPEGYEPCQIPGMFLPMYEVPEFPGLAQILRKSPMPEEFREVKSRPRPLAPTLPVPMASTGPVPAAQQGPVPAVGVDGPGEWNAGGLRGVSTPATLPPMPTSCSPERFLPADVRQELLDLLAKHTAKQKRAAQRKARRKGRSPSPGGIDEPR
jgi:hypothetical protein